MKTFIIQRKDTKELFHARSGKTSWKAPGHAKNAFHQSVSVYNIADLGLKMVSRHNLWSQPHLETPRFDEQDVWEIVELKHEASSDLDKAVAILRDTLGRCDWEIQKRIEKFLEELSNDI